MMSTSSVAAMIGPGRIANEPIGMPGAVVHAVDLLDAETLHQAVLDHGCAAGAALLGRLEDHHSIAGEVTGLGEVAGRTEQHRGVAVMATGVHLARSLGGVRQVGLLVDGQRVHVGTHADHLEPLAGRLAALDHADHAGLPEASHDLVAAELAQPVRNECCSAVDVVQQLRMLVDVPAPGLNIGLEVGDAVHDGHGRSQALLGIQDCLPCKHQST
ncbi:hypothetical protein ACVI53_001989 [Bradyrhizobium barranii subsp. barranii]